MTKNEFNVVEHALAIIVYDIRVRNVSYSKCHYKELIEKRIIRIDTKEEIVFNKEDTEARGTSLYKYKDYLIFINSSIDSERSNVIMQISKNNSTLFEINLIIHNERIVAFTKYEPNIFEYEITWEINNIFIYNKMKDIDNIANYSVNN